MGFYSPNLVEEWNSPKFIAATVELFGLLFQRFTRWRVRSYTLLAESHRHRLEDDPLKAQLRSDSGRSSKVINDRQGIEAVVEVAGAGELVLRVDSAGGFSLRGRPKGEEGKEGEEAARQVLLAVGVMRADRIVTVRPEEPSAEH